MKAEIKRTKAGWLVILVPDMKTMEIAMTKHDAVDWCLLHGVEVVCIDRNRPMNMGVTGYE